MNSRPKILKLTRIALPLMVIGIGIAIAAYFVGSRPQAKVRDSHDSARPVQIMAVSYGTITPEITNFGEVIASREAEFRAMVSGRLVYVAEEFKDGAVITAGTRVAQVDPFEFELAVAQAEANLTEAQARLTELQSDSAGEKKLLQLTLKQIDLRQRDRDRSANLIKQGQTSKKALDDANIALNSALESKEQRRQTAARAEAKIAQQRASIKRLEALLAQAQRALQDTEIVAPFTGYLTDTGVALGKRLAVGESIGRLISNDDLQVRFQLNNDDYSRLISQGKSDALFSREVAVKWHLGENTLNYQAQIERRAAEIDPASGGVTVYATIKATNAVTEASNALRPGAFVEISLADISYADVFSVPEDAVVDGNTIFAVEDNVLQAKNVEIVRRFSGKVLLKGNVEEGLSIVTAPFPNIGPGMPVRVFGE